MTWLAILWIENWILTSAICIGLDLSRGERSETRADMNALVIALAMPLILWPVIWVGAAIYGAAKAIESAIGDLQA